MPSQFIIVLKLECLVESEEAGGVAQWYSISNYVGSLEFNLNQGERENESEGISVTSLYGR